MSEKEPAAPRSLRLSLDDDRDSTEVRRLDTSVDTLDEPPGLRKLVLRVTGGETGMDYLELEPGRSYLLGRAAEADLRLDDLPVSRRHARIDVRRDGLVTIEDLGSRNGTFVNGRWVRRAELSPGDRLRLGTASLRLDPMTPDELRLLDRVRKQLRAAEHRDPLTGLPDRLYMETRLPRLLSWAREQGYPVSAVFMDLDHFKQVNDHYGHQVGDRVLQVAARLALETCRETDECIRYGGEEFLFFLFNASEEGAVTFAERLRRAFLRYPWERIAPGLALTGSFGVAERGESEPVEDWVRRADQAVYRAKHRGRNRVERASELEEGD